MDGRVPVLVIPNPLREAFVAEPEPFPVPLRRPVVAWIGRLDELKNWKEFIELAGKLSAEIWLAGKPVEAGVAQELLERSREAGILDRLRWYRGLPHDRVPAFLDAVRDSGGVAVSTSKGESFGMTVAEAMARRCAVVAPDRTPFTEFVEDGVNGRLYRPGAAAERVQELLDDAGQRARLGDKARESILARYAPEPALETLATSLRSL
jgi:glycosyltransferase involved in cell wall biosynthesis